MRKQTDFLRPMLLGSVILAILELSACGPAMPAPTLSVNVIHTSGTGATSVTATP